VSGSLTLSESTIRRENYSHQSRTLFVIPSGLGAYLLRNRVGRISSEWSCQPPPGAKIAWLARGRGGALIFREIDASYPIALAADTARVLCCAVPIHALTT
jgi:hypothetical protein